MKPETAWRRLWLDVTGLRIAFGVAVIGLWFVAAEGLVATLVSYPAGSTFAEQENYENQADLVLFLINSVPAAGVIAWIAREVRKANRWRARWTKSLLAIGLTLMGLLFIALVALISMLTTMIGGDLPSRIFYLIISVPAAVAIAWIACAVWKANRRRAFLTESLLVEFGSHGDSASDVACDLFPDVPVCVSRNWIYCARDREVDVQPLDHMAWVYAESFIMRYRYQLVIWNRHACANVLPLRKRYLGPALDRLRQAAPWLPVGYNITMKESWNADHHDFLTLIDSYRESRRRFDAHWVGSGIAIVQPAPRNSDPIQNILDREEKQELKKLTARWDKEDG